MGRPTGRPEVAELFKGHHFHREIKTLKGKLASQHIYQELDSRFRGNDAARLPVRHAHIGKQPGSCMIFGKYK